MNPSVYPLVSFPRVGTEAIYTSRVGVARVLPAQELYSK
jgi:hypothetical protein